MDYWKATEYRSSLLYTGLVFLRGIVSEDIYALYLKLAVAMNILHTENDERRNEYLPYALMWLTEHWNKHCALIYMLNINEITKLQVSIQL